MSEAASASEVMADLSAKKPLTIPLPEPGNWKSLNFWGYWIFAIGAFLIIPSCQLGTGVIKATEGLLLLGTLLLRLPIHRLPGFYFALCFALLQVLSVAMNWDVVRESDTVNGRFLKAIDGNAYNWVCLYAMVYAWQIAWLRKYLFYGLVVGLCLSAIVALGQLTIGYDVLRRPLRISSEGNRWNHSSGLRSWHIDYAFIMGCFSLLLLNTQMWKPMAKKWCYIFAAIAIVALICSGGRGVSIALPLALFVMLVFSGSKKRGVLLVVLLGIMVGCNILLLEWLRPGAIEKIGTGSNARWSMWQASMHMIFDNPLFGAGGKHGFRELIDLYPGGTEIDNKADAHNIFLCIATQYGVTAILSYFMLMGSIVVHVIRMRHYAPHVCHLVLGIGSLICVAGMFDDCLGHTSTAVCCYSILGLAVGCVAEKAGK